MAVINYPEHFPVVSGMPWHGVKYLCTTRAGGVSAEPFGALNLATHVADDPVAVQRNRAMLSGALGGNPVWLEQVHGTDVFDADTLPASRFATQGAAAVADAAITTRPDVVLAVLTADCLPVVVADTLGRAVGVAHAGWRGLAGGVLENTVNALRQRLPANAVLRAWIGPAISQPAFEVGPDVYQAFCENWPDDQMYFAARPAVTSSGHEKWLADLPGLARQRLWRAGLRYIECSGWCTLRQPELFFSYRASARTGRMATLAWIDQAPELP